MSTTVFVNDEYEHDDRWTAVDAYGVSNLHTKEKSNEILNEALHHIQDSGMPDDSTYPAFGKFLALHARSVKAKHILEVGLLGGYTAIWYLLQIPDARVTALEISPLHSKVSSENAQRAGVADRLEIITGPAVESLRKIKSEVASGIRPKFDFTFIDADKENNWAYFDYAADLSNSGAPIVVDNVIRKGWIVLDEHVNEPPVAGAREVIEKAGNDPRVDSCLLQTVSEKNYDGFLYALVK
ncbi:O-methyltransferase [Periconia macrospinosa]|uniref:O-methyltransferase n=1 Tax=Periconia macrospinosa TaxID=97972 RepID=A0A2V1DTX6_9PLEO|nr:O-methyltransferase [Periconia macrospinosa]